MLTKVCKEVKSVTSCSDQQFRLLGRTQLSYELLAFVTYLTGQFLSNYCLQ
jgi:hypothetical protein